MSIPTADQLSWQKRGVVSAVTKLRDWSIWKATWWNKTKCFPSFSISYTQQDQLPSLVCPYGKLRNYERVGKAAGGNFKRRNFVVRDHNYRWQGLQSFFPSSSTPELSDFEFIIFLLLVILSKLYWNLKEVIFLLENIGSEERKCFNFTQAFARACVLLWWATWGLWSSLTLVHAWKS